MKTRTSKRRSAGGAAEGEGSGVLAAVQHWMLAGPGQKPAQRCALVNIPNTWGLQQLVDGRPPPAMQQSAHNCPTICPPGVLFPLFPLHTSVLMQVPGVSSTSQLGGPSGVAAPWQHCTSAGPGHSPGVLVPPHVEVRRHLPPGQAAVVQHWKSSGPGHLPAARGGNGVSVDAVRGPPLLHACHATAASSSA